MAEGDDTLKASINRNRTANSQTANMPISSSNWASLNHSRSLSLRAGVKDRMVASVAKLVSLMCAPHWRVQYPPKSAGEYLETDG
ncbi:MAG: hypothetical protein AB7U35_14335, partial [Sphingobium sp.]